jgi:hypothetical protein
MTKLEFIGEYIDSLPANTSFQSLQIIEDVNINEYINDKDFLMNLEDFAGRNTRQMFVNKSTWQHVLYINYRNKQGESKTLLSQERFDSLQLYATEDFLVVEYLRGNERNQTLAVAYKIHKQ